MPQITGKTALSELIDRPLTPEADRALRRIMGFLHVVRTPAVQTKAILAGYSTSEHLTGFYHAGWTSGRRPLSEWRTWESLRPHRDPDLPDDVASMVAFVERWLPRVRAATDAVADPEDRAEVVAASLGEPPPRRCRTALAMAWAIRFKGFKDAAWEPYQRVWEALVAQGFEAELDDFEAIRARVEDHILRSPLDDEERSLMADARERAAQDAVHWLDERRKQFEGHLDEESMRLLALRDDVPPPMPLSLLDLAVEFPAASPAQA